MNLLNGRNKKIALPILIVVLAVALCGALLWWFFAGQPKSEDIAGLTKMEGANVYTATVDGFQIDVIPANQLKGVPGQRKISSPDGMLFLRFQEKGESIHLQFAGNDHEYFIDDKMALLDDGRNQLDEAAYELDLKENAVAIRKMISLAQAQWGEKMIQPHLVLGGE